MKILKLIGIVFVTFSFIQCAPTRFEDNLHFKVKEAIYNNWINARPVSEIKIMVEYTSSLEIKFDSIYFRNRIAKIELNTKESKTYLIGFYNTSNRDKHDLIIDINTKKEINNKPPLQKTFPFELKLNEAVISYKKNGKTKYFKIKNVKSNL